MNKKSKTTVRTSKSVDPVEKFQLENDDSIFEIIGELAKLDNREVEDKLKQMTDRKILDFKAVQKKKKELDISIDLALTHDE